MEVQYSQVAMQSTGAPEKHERVGLAPECPEYALPEVAKACATMLVLRPGQKEMVAVACRSGHQLPRDQGSSPTPQAAMPST